MKKSILIILILVESIFSLPNFLSDSSKCHFLYGIELGYITKGDIFLYDIKGKSDELNYNTFYSNFAAGFIAYGFYIKADIKVPVYSVKSSFSFFPFASYFNNSFGYQNGKIDIGFRHLCAHPIVPAMPYAKIPKMINGGYSEIFVKFGNF